MNKIKGIDYAIFDIILPQFVLVLFLLTYHIPVNFVNISGYLVKVVNVVYKYLTCLFLGFIWCVCIKILCCTLVITWETTLVVFTWKDWGLLKAFATVVFTLRTNKGNLSRLTNGRPWACERLQGVWGVLPYVYTYSCENI